MIEYSLYHMVEFSPPLRGIEYSRVIFGILPISHCVVLFAHISWACLTHTD